MQLPLTQETLFIVMPAYNEEANIARVVEQWHPVAERINADGGKGLLLVANDGSRDSTSEILHRLESEYPYLRAIDKPNSGHGATLMFLYRHALDNGADFVFQTDSDGQTEPAEFRQFWERRHNYDFQIGSRTRRQDGLSRVIVTKILKLTVLIIFKAKVPDANTPFRLMSAEAMRKVMAYIPADYPLANVAMAAAAVRLGLRCRWSPVTFRPRQGGINSINLRRICRIGVKAIGDFRRISREIRKCR